jgi:hypothetical protein
MFAEDLQASLAPSAAGLQAIVDRASAHYHAWRMKASILKPRVMVVRGKGAAARRAAPLKIRWGGPSGQRIDKIDEYVVWVSPFTLPANGMPKLNGQRPRLMARPTLLHPCCAPAAHPPLTPSSQAPGQHCPAPPHDRVECRRVAAESQRNVPPRQPAGRPAEVMLVLTRHHLCHSTLLLELGLWTMPLCVEAA